jgi:hypothetical protein
MLTVSVSLSPKINPMRFGANQTGCLNRDRGAGALHSLVWRRSPLRLSPLTTDIPKPMSTDGSAPRFNGFRKESLAARQARALRVEALVNHLARPSSAYAVSLKSLTKRTAASGRVGYSGAGIVSL